MTYSALTEKSGVLDWIEPEHEMMTDGVFYSKALCRQRGLFERGLFWSWFL